MKDKKTKKPHPAKAINKDNLEHASGGWSTEHGCGYFFNNDEIERLSDAGYTVTCLGLAGRRGKDGMYKEYAVRNTNNDWVFPNEVRHVLGPKSGGLQR